MKTLKELFGGFNKDKPAVEEAKAATPFIAVGKSSNVPKQAKTFKVDPLNLSMHIGISHEHDWKENELDAMAKEAWEEACKQLVESGPSSVNLDDVLNLAKEIFMQWIMAQQALDQFHAAVAFTYVSTGILETYLASPREKKEEPQPKTPPKKTEKK